MAKLIYGGILSLDGYIADAEGGFDWAMPDEAVHRFINELERPIGTYLYGRRMYEIMVAWETMEDLPELPPYVLDYARIWKAAEKLVYSRTLSAPSSSRTRLLRDFDPEAVRELKRRSEADLGIGGAELASEAMRSGLVDEYYLFLVPVLLGGGKPFFPRDLPLELELLAERRFDTGMVYLRYRDRRAS